MNKLIVPILSVLSASPLFAGQAESFFRERSKDFGIVSFGPVLEHDFKFTNTSNQVVTITGARVSCGCVSATIPVNSLRPGESTVVKAFMDTKRFVGPKTVTIFISFGNPRDEVSLTVTANRNDSFSKSAEMFALGKVRRGNEGKSTIRFTMRNDPYFEIRGAGSATDFVSAKAEIVQRTTTETIVDVSATMKPGLDVGPWVTEVYVSTSNPTLPQIRIPLYVEVTPAITATPARIDIPNIKVGDKKEVNVIVKGEAPFKIVDVKGGDDLLSVVADNKEAKAAHIVRLVFKPNSAGDVTKNIIVVTDDRTANQVIIPVRAKANME